jgi:hypothetical protein
MTLTLNLLSLVWLTICLGWCVWAVWHYTNAAIGWLNEHDKNRRVQQREVEDLERRFRDE